MKTILIVHRIAKKFQQEYVTDFVQRFNRLNIKGIPVHFDEISFKISNNGIELYVNRSKPIQFAGIFLKSVLGHPSDIQKMQTIETLNIPLFNSVDSCLNCNNKHICAIKCLNNSLKIPDYFLLSKDNDTATFFKAEQELGYPMIVKPLQGSNGKGIKKIIEKTSTFSRKQILQQWLPNAAQNDIRAFVINEKVVTAMKRFPKPGDFRANLSLGGSAIPWELSPDEEETAIRAAKALNLHFAGVDLILTHSGDPIVLEVNNRPGYKIAGITGCDIKYKMCESIASHTKKENSFELKPIRIKNIISFRKTLNL